MMKPIEEDKGCLNNGPIQEPASGGTSCMSFEFHKNNTLTRSASSHHRTALGKPTPSKWDDAQKWLVNLSRGEIKNPAKASPRSSNADDRRLIVPVPKKEYPSSGEDEETKNVDCDESVWRINKPLSSSKSAVRSICVRDMGTEMTPIVSQEPSRTATPLRATTPAARSPISSGPSTPVWDPNGLVVGIDSNGQNVVSPRRDGESKGDDVAENKDEGQSGKENNMERRAVAWDEAERAKYLARYKREEVKIEAWENHQKRKAEMENRKVEVKAERMKCRAQEKCTNKLAATRRIAEEKRANAEAKLNEKAVKTSQRADYIRRTGHLPSSFSFKLSSFCW
ncbi:hypothetical protein CASFOL_006273 [Castilleja foliolosa]|uniref:Remorin C-terminal domain-containing protein n=1 Tax=Castilleja foliolosa TaxID=1961234 RepID=A0ABD3E9U2_9LAMI